MSSPICLVSTPAAPAAIGPYSQAVKAGGIVYLSGQIGLDPETGRMVAGGVEAEAAQVFRNLKAVLAAAESGMERVLRCTVFLLDMDDFALVNRLYAEAFGDHAPARATVAVSALPKGAKVEVDAIALEV